MGEKTNRGTADTGNDDISLEILCSVHLGYPFANVNSKSSVYNHFY